MCTVVSSLFSNDKTKILFTPWKLGLIKKSMDLAFLLILLVHICYFFQLIVLLKPDFDCWSSFALSRVDKVTTQGFVSVIANVVAFASLDTTHLLDQVEIRLISQLIKSKSSPKIH